jgi:hypothetical protein
VRSNKEENRKSGLTQQLRHVAPCNKEFLPPHCSFAACADRARHLL